MRSTEEEAGHIKIPMPVVAPLGVEVTSDAVQEVWNVFVKPGQESGVPQSFEERVLMAILRSVYQGLTEREHRQG